MSAPFTGPLRRTLTTAADDARFTFTGGPFAQPVRLGQLQGEFYPDECGSLDAPDYLPVGGAYNTSSRTFGAVGVSIGRERLQ